MYIYRKEFPYFRYISSICTRTDPIEFKKGFNSLKYNYAPCNEILQAIRYNIYKCIRVDMPLFE